MKFNSVLKIAAGAVLMTAFTTAMAQIRHFNFEGTFNAQTQGEGNLTTRSNIVSALDGKAFSVSFDLNFGTSDSDGLANVGQFTNSVSNTSAASGGVNFAPISNSCLQPQLDCFVKVTNDEFSPVNIDSYLLRTGFVESASLNTLVGSNVSLSFTFFAQQIGLFSSANILGPNEYSTSNLSVFSRNSQAGASFITSFGLGQQSEFGRANFGLNVTRISEATSYIVPTTAVPEPETYAMMLAGLGLMGAVARRRKAKLTA